jgi:chemotaxis protein methyltransferase CheR
MTVAATDVERFREVIAARLGLAFDDGKLGQLGELMRRRLDELGTTAASYLQALDARELSALAAELTVPETYFFRNIAQFHALAAVVLPERIKVRGPGVRLRMLSAGCATGEEPFSLAMTACDTPDCQPRIRAVDINPAALARAATGRYSTWALRETSAEARVRWFRPDGRDFMLDDAIRASVDFETRNLAVDDAELWQPGSYDVIFCRNVLMYFTPVVAREVVERIERALAPGGYLFLGHAETLRGLSQRFHLCHTHETFYYQRRDGGPVADFVYAPPSSPEAALVVEISDSWVDTIRRASERVHALALPLDVPVAPRWDLGAALDLLRRERYSEALDTLHALPADATQDPDVLLLRAVLLVHSGQLADADQAARHLLAIDELSAGAHYLLALCCEAAGELAKAGEHDRVAIYLDPSFAMPRLHLGVMARRAGERSAAQRELGQAMLLLQREDASRVVLFGGGFHREALIALCKAELGAS